MNGSVPISVIIPTLNEEKYLGTLLRSLKPQLKPGDELIIVDSYSSDGTVKIARKYTRKIFFMPPLGIGPAKTFGARRAKNRIAAFLDADTAVPADWLDKVRGAFIKGFDVFYGYAFFSSDSVFRRVLLEFLVRLGYFACDAMNWVSGVRWVSPNNCAFEKNIFLKVGGYKRVVCEDWDLAVRFFRRFGRTGVRQHFDGSATVLTSDRRLVRHGIFRTLAGWVAATIGILMNRVMTDSRRYGAVR